MTRAKVRLLVIASDIVSSIDTPAASIIAGFDVDSLLLLRRCLWPRVTPFAFGGTKSPVWAL